ncbi:unnamed protein product [Nippostrongylus brasiliensis]|uniref:G_PROTEIN_RECEP_F1_2 domain-containing protein n=1 Tax=Nippostrongylus brasiliensis TaxID=27835 RepID=A0A0N4Y6N2_NIPBR|nr:unnamed protein product [Nippostrongylus brasiliensis]
MGLWYPVLPECQDHLEGVFEPRYVFIAQGMRFFVCRPAHSSVSTTVALVAIIPLSLFLIKCSDLYRHEMEMNYCKLRKQWIRIGLVCALYVLYVLFTLAQEIGLLVLLRDITPYEENIIKSPDRIKSFKESPRELLETAKANTVVEKSDALQVTPRARNRLRDYTMGCWNLDSMDFTNPLEYLLPIIHPFEKSYRKVTGKGISAPTLSVFCTDKNGLVLCEKSDIKHS